MYSLKNEEIDKSCFTEIPALNETYLYSSLEMNYEKAYFQNLTGPYSLNLYKKEKLIGTVPYTLSPEGDLSFFNRPLKVFWDTNVNSDDRFELYQILLNDLEKKLDTKVIRKIKLSSDTSLYSGLQKYPLQLGSYSESFIDLKSSEEIIKRGIRKSYRSLINWGLREMTFIRLDKNNADYELFESFRLFHIEISGRETRSKQTWDLQFEMIKSGLGFLELGFFEKSLVSGALILLGEKEAFYGVAVNNRTMMAEKKPIGHAVIFRSIIHSKILGMEIFNLGFVGPEFSNEKEAEIGKFKKGFASEMRLNHFFEAIHQELV